MAGRETVWTNASGVKKHEDQPMLKACLKACVRR
jgi:hypothetical protein